MKFGKGKWYIHYLISCVPIPDIITVPFVKIFSIKREKLCEQKKPVHVTRHLFINQ